MIILWVSTFQKRLRLSYYRYLHGEITFDSYVE